ncbi:L-threonylcarbamoyladenylate synthase [Candidatus Endoriftia persephone]|jgi:L-threonylcarbamoyladenylate synthase|uniref:Threonylcarbamoyl-AMP synthase n=2 Tax=Gammaproteobacteria TaxID=1236 RepID=G2DHC5_9GAMM|nr:Sua5/YciO/YrdC/YwlC family protein [Candidatus Endoriftia persephone]EGV49982.1 putative ribosome maturation factor rimN [endosymbiont of Riftia pachyptila (vent Ph05)]USF87534.1 Sua5/YciO/YrdC/YwlC family protein [Candidatus Endoriftia persephone]
MPNSKPTLPANPSIHPWRLRQAARVILGGGILAYPTESVFGLGCDPLNPQAVFRLLRLKQRPVSKGLILIASDFNQLQPFIDQLPSQQLEPVIQSWPGPHTWVLPAAPTLPFWLRGDHSGIAVRVTNHPLAAALCRASGRPLVSTSANRSNHPPARNALQVRLCCGGEIDMILHGATQGLAQPTSIRDALTGIILRS